MPPVSPASPDQAGLALLAALVRAAQRSVAPVPVLAGAGWLASTPAATAVGGEGGTTAPGSATPGTTPSGYAPSGDAERDRIAALVDLARGGDTEAFAAIYDVYVDQVYRYVYYRCSSHALAEDLTSETFLRALRRIDSFTWQGKDIGAWLVTIARNLVADHVKSSRFRLEVTTADMLDADRADDGIEETVLTRLENAALVDAVRKLKPEQQECIVLRFLQGLSVAETALAMGRTEGAVKQLQLRAVRALAKLVEAPA